MAAKRFIIVLFGPPGSGKGTQSDLLGPKLGLPVIAIGELLRAQEAARSHLGLKVRRFTRQGLLVPDHIIHQIIAQRLAKKDTKKGFILDGYPRDSGQLDDLLKLAQDKDRLLFVEIKVGGREVLNRLTGRRVCVCGASYHLVYHPPRRAGRCDVCGRHLTLREDDRPAVVRRRLADYEKEATPLLVYGRRRHNLLSVDGKQTIARVEQEIWNKVKKMAISGQ